MTQDNNLRRCGLSRRDLLGLVGKAGLASGGALLLGKCKGSTTPEPPPPPPPPPPPVNVDVLVRFYNHTQGYIGEKTYNGMSDSLLPVKVSDCPDLSTVEPDRIAVREAANGGWLGKYIEFSRTGQLTSAKFPRQNMEYDAFLMNRTSGADYGLIDNYPSWSAGKLLHSPASTWNRLFEDSNCSGPDEVPREAMRQIKEALILPWAKYMDFSEVPPDPKLPWTGDFYVGYICPPRTDYPGCTFRCHTHDRGVWVNPNVCQDQGHPALRVFLERIIMHIAGCVSERDEMAPAGLLTYQYVTDDAGIIAVGKDLLAYVPVKDIQHVLG